MTIANLRLLAATGVLAMGKPTGKCYVASPWVVVSFIEVRELLNVKE